MLEYLEELLKSKYDYDLTQKKVCQAPIVKNKFVLPMHITFGVILLVYILMLANIIPDFLNLAVVIIAFLLLVVLPFKLGYTRSKYAAMIITPKYIIQAVNKREFVIIEFDSITKFIETQRGELIVSEGNKKIVIEKVCYEGKLQPVMDILEAKGKTFDKKKDYMIRPIEIFIEDGEIIIKDIEVVSTTDQVFEKYYKDYKMLTPGFIGDIIFRNAVVDEVIVDETELVLKLDHFEVNPGHPENTKFESIIVEEAVLIFEEVNIMSVNKIDTHDKKPIIEKLEADIDSFVDEIESGIIAEWTIRGKVFHVKFAAGVFVYDVAIGYKEVLCGWNKTR